MQELNAEFFCSHIGAVGVTGPVAEAMYGLTFAVINPERMNGYNLQVQNNNNNNGHLSCPLSGEPMALTKIN